MKLKTILTISLLLATGCKNEASQEATAKSAAEVISMRITVQLTRGGAATVLDVVEQPGMMPVSTAFAGDYVYEVYEGTEVLAVESIVDPFELRAVARPGTNPEHSHLQADAATISLRVPGVAAQGRSLGVRIHRLTRDPGTDRIDAASLAGLTRSGALVLATRIDPAVLAPALSRARRLPETIRDIEQ